MSPRRKKGGRRRGSSWLARKRLWRIFAGLVDRLCLIDVLVSSVLRASIARPILLFMLWNGFRQSFVHRSIARLFLSLYIQAKLSYVRRYL